METKLWASEPENVSRALCVEAAAGLRRIDPHRGRLRNGREKVLGCSVSSSSSCNSRTFLIFVCSRGRRCLLSVHSANSRAHMSEREPGDDKKIYSISWSYILKDDRDDADDDDDDDDGHRHEHGASSADQEGGEFAAVWPVSPGLALNPYSQGIIIIIGGTKRFVWRKPASKERTKQDQR